MNNYTMNQSEEEQYKKFEKYLAYLDQKMFVTKMTMFRAIYTDIVDLGIDLDSNLNSPQLKQMIENYFWALGLPFVKIEQYAKWFVEQARCQDTMLAV